MTVKPVLPLDQNGDCDASILHIEVHGPERFTLIDNRIQSELHLEPGPFAVYAALLSFANNQTGVAWPSLETLAERASVKSITTLRKYLGVLEDVGLVFYVNTKAANGALGSNRYIVARSVDDIPSLQDKKQNLMGGISKSDIGVCQNLTGGMSKSDKELYTDELDVVEKKTATPSFLLAKAKEPSTIPLPESESEPLANDATSQVIALWQQNVGFVNPMQVDALIDMVKENGIEFVTDAIKEAAQSSRGVPSIKYLQAIVRRWQRDGNPHAKGTATEQQTSVEWTPWHDLVLEAGQQADAARYTREYVSRLSQHKVILTLDGFRKTGNPILDAPKWRDKVQALFANESIQELLNG